MDQRRNASHRKLIPNCTLFARAHATGYAQPQAEDAPNTRTNTAASSFFLTPLNYFDADVSLDSANAILLRAPASPGDAYEFDDYGVREAHCMPPRALPFAYSGARSFGLDGKPMEVRSAEEMRREAELFHRIKVEL